MIRHLNRNQKILQRSRLNQLIQDGLRYPLLILLAGPGYGKTQAMEGYLTQSGVNYFWLSLSSLDNLSAHFWDHLVQELGQKDEKFSEFLQNTTVPDDFFSFGGFAEQMSEMTEKHKEMIWIFDDFGEINNPQIISFIKMLANAHLKNFHLVLISNILGATEAISYTSKNRALILAKDFLFTRYEIAGLYEAYGIKLESEELSALEYYTEGWPLPVSLLALSHIRVPAKIKEEGHLALRVIFQMFNEQFFSQYPKQKQELLVKAAMLNSFTLELCIDLHEGEKDWLEELRSHMFVRSEPASGRFFFLRLYHIFLRGKTYLLTPKEEQQVWEKAAEHYERSEETAEAIICYHKCGDHIAMLKVIREYIRLENEITYENADFFLKHLDYLTEQEVQEHLVSEHLRAIIYLNLLELEKSEEVLRSLAERLQDCDTSVPEASLLLGEVYGAMGTIHMLKNQEDFASLYEKALYYLPEGSNFHNRNKLSTRDNHCFVLPDNRRGAKERMEQAMHKGMPWVQRFLMGSMSGKEHLFSAEGAYLSGEMSEAKQHAYRAVYKAKANAQHDLVCSSYLLLGRIALMTGDFGDMSRQIQDVIEYAEACENTAINEIRDTALGWYYVKLSDDKLIPKSIYTMNDDSKPMWTYGRSQIVYGVHLIHTGEYARLVGMLEYPKGPFFIQGITPDRITLHIMLAIGYYYLNNLDAAIKSLWTAYDMSYNNGLNTLFAEGGTHILPLLKEAGRQDAFSFQSNWLHKIEKETNAYIEQVKKVRGDYRRQNTEDIPEDSPLSKRERVVLQSLSQGRTREEIAAEHCISVNTVKSVIRSIYNKLSAGNRAEAVSIAISKGYIKGYRSE